MCMKWSSLTFSVHAREGYSNFVCLSVAHDLDDDGLLALQRDTNLNRTMSEFATFLKYVLVLLKKRENSAVGAHLRPHPLFYK